MTQARLLGGRYQVGELLGYGGMAEVHRGRDLRLGRDVAIKMLRTDLARDDTFQLRFRREAQNAASLNHPAIVAVYDTGEERGSSGESLPYIVMEFVNGRTLKEVLQAEGRLMPRRALEITAEICAALEFSHRHGIIHRDIKPGNVMLTQTGQIKVMDFGIARALANSGSTMTQTSAVIGTAQYLSPEQARGEPVDARSDVYATGCVIYELITGQPPFVGDSPVSVAYQHVREDPRPPSMLNRDVPPAIDAVVLKALAKNPQNRYQSAAEMRADLLRAAQGRPVYAEPVMVDDHGATRVIRAGAGGRPAPGRGGQRRKNSPWAVWGLIGLAAAAVVALIIGLIASTGGGQKTVPNLNNHTKDEALQLLTSVGLQGNAVDQTNPGCEKNKVIPDSQTPAAGASVGDNTVVRFAWCAGTGVQTVPLDVVGKSQADATTELEGLHFTVTPVQIDSAKPLGTVVKTDPDAGKDAAGGSEVKIYISKFDRVVVPDLTGKTEADAKAVLEFLKFTAKPIVLTSVTNDPTQVGKVISQDPKALDAQNNPVEWDPAKAVTIVIGISAATTPPPTTPPPTT
jgi:serine/threonine-protein kinase